MNDYDKTVRAEIIEDDFKTRDFQIVYYDGVNFSGAIYGNTLSQSYINGDTYERIYDTADDKVTKVTIKFHEKESNITCYVEKDSDGNIVYKKDNSINTTIITKTEYEEFANKFISKNNYSILDLIKNMGLDK